MLSTHQIKFHTRNEIREYDKYSMTFFSRLEQNENENRKFCFDVWPRANGRIKTFVEKQANEIKTEPKIFQQSYQPTCWSISSHSSHFTFDAVDVGFVVRCRCHFRLWNCRKLEKHKTNVRDRVRERKRTMSTGVCRSTALLFVQTTKTNKICLLSVDCSSTPNENNGVYQHYEVFISFIGRTIE